MSSLPPAKARPPAPDPPERNDWRKRLHAETPEAKAERLAKAYPPRSWMHTKRQGKFLEDKKRYAEEDRKAEERRSKVKSSEHRMFPPNDSDGQGHGLPPSDDVPF